MTTVNDIQRTKRPTLERSISISPRYEGRLLNRELERLTCTKDSRRPHLLSIATSTQAADQRSRRNECAIDMPRLPTSLLRRARVINPFLPALLQPCRDLRAANNELRWLREHVDEIAKARDAKGKNTLLRKLVKDRASGKPLQYILGTEYFGDLEIRCQSGVLIPRFALSLHQFRYGD